MVIRKYITYLSHSFVLLAQALLAVTVFATLVQGQNPVGYWTFDDGSGADAVDSSGNGNRPLLFNGVAWVPGKIGEAISANAERRQYVGIPPIDLSRTKAVTVALWTNRTYSTTGGHVLFEATKNYNNSLTGFGFFPDDDTCAGIQAALRGDLGYVSNCYSQPSSGVWHHLAAVFDKSQTGGNEVKLYVDGVLQPVTRSVYASTNTNTFGDNPIYLFSRAGVTGFDSGMIDDLRIYDSALTSEQILQVYSNAGSGSAATPVNISITDGGQQQVMGVTSPIAAPGNGSGINQGNTGTLPPAGSGWQQGFDFRNTKSFVSDPSGSTYVLSTTAYPTKGSGGTYGWVNTYRVQGRDRNAKLDPRLAGINMATNGAPATFYVDLPSSGAYNLSLAMGDASYEDCWKQCQIQFLDGNTVLATVAEGLLSLGYFYDAAGNDWSAAAWPTSNASQQVTLAGTRLTMLLGTSKLTGDFTPIAFLGVAQVSTPAFTISASPASLSVVQGNQGTSTITTTVSGGFNGAISLSASGMPSGTTVSFNPQSIPAPGSGSSTMTITVGASTPTGTYPITVTGNGGGIQQTATVTLTVTAAPNFTISASPASLSVVQGNQGTSTITTTVSGGFNSAISLSASGMPSGTTVSFNPQSIPAPGSGSSTMTFTVGASTPAGTYPITVTGNGGGVQQNATVTLTVTAAPNFTISASPASLSVVQGNQGTSTITTTVSGGFNGAISLSASGMPSGTTVSFNPQSIPAPGSGSSTMTITVGASTPAGTYPITVTGNGGGVQQNATVTLTVTAAPNFTISASPASLSVVQGNQGTSTITTTVSGGFNGAISLSASGMPSGTTVSFNPQSIPAPGSGSSTMTITVGASTPTGTYPITVTGNGGGIQQTATVTLTVTAAPNFTISASPASLSVVQGNQGTSTITTTVSGGFNSAISLSASGMPSGTTVSFNPQSIPAPGSGSSTMTFTVGASTPAGTYPITVTGNGGGIQKTAAVTLTVTAAPNFTISASPASLSVVQGNQGTSTITTTVSGGFNSAISLSGSGMPSGTTVSFNPQSIPAPGSGGSTMTITVGASTPAGTYPITVTGNGGGIQQNATVTLTVTAAPNFTISASPTSLSVGQGNQGTSIITTTVSGGFNGAISLSASGMPSGTTVSFNPQSIPAPGSGSSTMTITVGASTPAGTYPITVTGNGGGVQQNATVTLTVTAAPNFTISASPASLSVVQGNQGTSIITTTVSGGFNSAISLSASGMPSGTTVSFNPQSIPAPGSGSSTMTITVGASTPTGTYPITVTGNGGGIQQTATVTLTVTAAPNFTISASPASLSVVQGNQGTSTITTTVSGGFNSAISLSASGMPSGTTISFNPQSIPAPGSGSSIMTITVGASTPAGTYPITVTGNGGGVQQNVSVTLTVTAQVALAWTASSSPGTAGYNAYRSTTSGGPYTKLNSAGLISTTNYIDLAVQNGNTYYYVTTAVSSQGMESAYSNQAAATVP